jgi:hypothetical protein
LALQVTTAQNTHAYQFIAVLELEHLIGFQHCNRRAIGIGGIEGALRLIIVKF